MSKKQNSYSIFKKIKRNKIKFIDLKNVSELLAEI